MLKQKQLAHALIVLRIGVLALFIEGSHPGSRAAQQAAATPAQTARALAWCWAW